MSADEVIRQALALDIDERRRIIARLEETCEGKDAWRVDALLLLYKEITGKEASLFSRDSGAVWARAMVAYELLQEGYTLEAVAVQMCKGHPAIIHYRHKMEEALSMPGMYQDILPTWEALHKRAKEI